MAAGGNFGVITRFRYRLTEILGMYCGSMSYRGPALHDVLTRLFELDASGPDALVTQAVVWWSDEDGGPIVKIKIEDPRDAASRR